MKSKIQNRILIICLLTIACSCSNTKFLGEDETLYTGTKSVNIIPEGEQKRLSAIETSLFWSAYHPPNNSFYSKRRIMPPVRLWIFNYMKTDKEKGFKSWMHRNFSKEPVLISDLNLDQRVKMLENQLFNEGYFGSVVNYKLLYNQSNQKKALVNYQVLLPQPYKIGTLTANKSNFTDYSVPDVFKSKTLLKQGKNYKLNTFLEERDRITRLIRNEGYFAFRKDFVEFRLDTAGLINTIDVEVSLKDRIPETATRKYSIKRIKFSLKNEPDDSIPGILKDTIRDGNFEFIYDKLFVKTSVLKKAIYQKPGEIFTQTRNENSFNHLGNLGVFRQINITYDTIVGDDSNLRMNVFLTPLDKVSLSLEGNVVTKSTGFVGPAIVARMTHQNLFGGAEKLDFSLNAGYEWQVFGSENSGLGFNSYELGINTSLSFPKVLGPFGLSRLTNKYVPKTTVSAGFDLMNRVQYYRMNSLNASLSYQWKGSLNNQHSFSLLDVNYVDLVDTTPEFSEIIQENPSIRRSFEEQFIISLRYRYSYDNSMDKRKIHQFFLETGVVSAGNIIGLIDKSINSDSEDTQGQIFGTPYSQFLKLSGDLRYYYNTGRKSTIVNRFYVGVGLPYGNSTILPYVEQFFSGGANSIRGFVARSIGPGEYRGDTLTYFDQTGDIKLEYNLEYRFRIGQKLYGATYLDVGNIWLHEEDILRPGSGFNFNTFYKQFAIGTGFGIRFDIDFFVLRFDIGLPLRHPGYEKGEQWVFTNPDIFKLRGFIAIGYPF